MRGRALESAVGLACRHYERQGRAYVFKRPTATATRPNGEVVYTAKSGVDWNGSIAGGAIHFDTKETHSNILPLANIEEHQVDALRTVAKLGARAGLVVGFLPSWECLWVPWEALQAFLAAPYRQSLTRAWCQAEGLLLRVQSTGAGPRVLFLDGEPHPMRDEAKKCVEVDRASYHRAPRVAPPVAASPRVDYTDKATREARLRDAVQEGISNQLGKRRRKRAGWRR
jgi:penicillin-binding protein-related factor A (putative recombinase)